MCYGNFACQCSAITTRKAFDNAYITFTLWRSRCPIVYLYNTPLYSLCEERYLGLHLYRRLIEMLTLDTNHMKQRFNLLKLLLDFKTYST